jgi:hypothetical protein
VFLSWDLVKHSNKFVTFSIVCKDREVESVHPRRYLDCDLRRFTLDTNCHQLSTQTPTQWVPGTLSLGVKQPGREADHSPPSSAEVKNAWSYTSTPSIRLHGMALS